MAFEEVIDKPGKGIWKPSLGESIEGEVVRIEAGKFGTEHTIATKEGTEMKLPSHKQLQNKLEDIKGGQYIRVTKIGEKASPKGQATQMYRVEIDKSYVPQVKLTGTTASQTPPNPGSPIPAEGQIIEYLRKYPNLDDKSFWFAVQVITPNFGDAMAVVEHLKHQGRIISNDGIWMAT